MVESVAALMRVPAAREWLLDTSSSCEARSDPESFRFSFSNMSVVRGDPSLASVLVGDQSNSLTLKGYEAGLALLWSAPENDPAQRLAELHSTARSLDGRPSPVFSSRSVGHFGKAEYAIVVIFTWLEDHRLVVTFNKVTFATRFSQSYMFEWQPGDVLRPTKLCSTVKAEAARVMKAEDMRTLQLMKKEQDAAKAGGLATLVREQFWKRWVMVVKMTWEGDWITDYWFNGLHVRRSETVRMTHDDDLLDNIDSIANGILDDLVANISCEVNLNHAFADLEPVPALSEQQQQLIPSDSRSVNHPAGLYAASTAVTAAATSPQQFAEQQQHEQSVQYDNHNSAVLAAGAFGARENGSIDGVGGGAGASVGVSSTAYGSDGGAAVPFLPMEDLARLRAYPNREEEISDSGPALHSKGSSESDGQDEGCNVGDGAQKAGGAKGGGSSTKRRYLCVFCERMYTNKANLDRHVQMVHENQAPYECKICAMRFSVKCNLTRHVLNVHNHNRPFKCPIPDCTWSFSQKYDLRRHLKRKHNLVGDPAERIIEVARASAFSNDTRAS